MRLAADAPFVTRVNANWVAGALALGVHALFVLLLVFGVSWQTQHPAPVMVDLWQALPAAEPPVAVRPPEPVKPTPEPKPAPVPKPAAEEPPPPKAPDIALEKKKAETEHLKKLKAMQAAEDRAREDAAMNKARDTQRAEQKKRALLRQMEADELKQSMANETAANAARQAKQAAAQAKLAEAQAAGKQQAALAQAVGQYRDLISAKVRGNTRLPDNLKGNPQVRCLVKLLPTGEVVPGSVRVTQSSGNAAYDEAVVRAIEKSSPLPLPSEREARAAFVPELSITHRPKE